MVTITSVESGSLAEQHGIKKGDILISVDGHDIADVLDYRFYLTEETVAVTYERNGVRHTSTIKKDQYADIGLSFETYLMDEKQSCRNKCIFCFIDQNPHGMRKDIYFKDDDSRLSFFFGNYITLTNMKESDIDRIITMHISPVNISVHTTNPELRVRMMNNKNAGKVLSYIDKLVKADIAVNAQIVLCKDINDGKELERTLSDLSAYYPALQSIAVVPSGLTAHREGLYPLQPFEKDDAREVLAIIDKAREKNIKAHGEALIQASDEWYLKAQLPIPEEDYYDGYPQLDNGVGSIRSMADEIDEGINDLLDEDFTLASERTVSLVTGKAAYDFLCEKCKKLEEAFPKLHIHVHLAVNHFFGESITVSGLLTGQDMLAAVKGKTLGDTLFIPGVTLKANEDIFLDDMTLADFTEKVGVNVIPQQNDGYAFVRSIVGLDC